MGGLLVPFLEIIPFVFWVIGSSLRFWKKGKRIIRTATIPVRLKKMGLWQDGNTNEALQEKLDAYIELMKKEPIKILGSSALPKPMRFARDNVKNVSLKLRFKFDTEFDNHDFFNWL